MEDRLYADIATHIKRNKSKTYKESVIKNYSALLNFCLKEHLIEGDYFNDDGTLQENGIVYESNLTERGKNIFYNLMIKWFSYTDKTQKYDNIKMLEKYLTQLEK